MVTIPPEPASNESTVASPQSRRPPMTTFPVVVSVPDCIAPVVRIVPAPAFNDVTVIEAEVKVPPTVRSPLIEILSA